MGRAREKGWRGGSKITDIKHDKESLFCINQRAVSKNSHDSVTITERRASDSEPKQWNAEL